MFCLHFYCKNVNKKLTTINETKWSYRLCSLYKFGGKVFNKDLFMVLNKNIYYGTTLCRPINITFILFNKHSPPKSPPFRRGTSQSIYLPEHVGFSSWGPSWSSTWSFVSQIRRCKAPADRGRSLACASWRSRLGCWLWSEGNCIKIGLPGKLILSKRKGLREVRFSWK